MIHSNIEQKVADIALHQATGKIHTAEAASTILTKNPETAGAFIAGYGALIDTFNELRENKSPYLFLFPRAHNLASILTTIGIDHIPTIREMQTQREWNVHYLRALKDKVIPKMVQGQTEIAEGKIHSNPQSIYAGSYPNVAIETNMASAGLLMLEQVILHRYPQIGGKDSLVHALTAMQKWRMFAAKDEPATSLYDRFVEAGWIKEDDKMQQLISQYFEMRNRLSHYRKKTVYIIRNGKRERIFRSSELTDTDTKNGFTEWYRLGVFTTGNCAFGLSRKTEYKNGVYTKKRGDYVLQPFALATGQTENPIAFLDEDQSPEIQLLTSPLSAVDDHEFRYKPFKDTDQQILAGFGVQPQDHAGIFQTVQKAINEYDIYPHTVLDPHYRTSGVREFT